MSAWHTQEQQQQQPQVQQPDESGMNAGSMESMETNDTVDTEPKGWESRGTVFELVLDVASIAFSRIFLLLTLVGSLEAAADSFMRCSREETPALKHYGEELICHYTKAFIFTFPAMAATVLVLMLGRDLLQKRLYYGLLKNRGVITFSENTPQKDPMFMAMFVDFLHCVSYTLFHMMILHRQGEMHDLSTQGFVPEVQEVEAPEISGVEDAAAFLLAAFRGGGPKLGAGAKSGTRVNPFGEGEMAGHYMETVMLLVATFLETVLLIIFIYYAYDITASLVPMSEYLDAYEDLAAEDHKFSIPRLHTFKDTVAKRILEDSRHVIPSLGDCDTIYQRVVTKYLAHIHEIRGTEQKIVQVVPRVEDPSPRRFVWTTIQELSSIGLSRSLWPAELLMRREVQGPEAKKFRRTWIIFASLALMALVYFLLILGAQMLRELALLVGSRDWQQLVPLCIMLVHAWIVCIAIWSFVESVAPFAFSRQPNTPRTPRTPRTPK